MSRRTAGLVAWSLLAASAAVGFAGTGLKLAFSDVVVTHFLSNDLMGIAVFFTAGIVGALVASRLPSNPIGWIFVGVAVSMGLSGLADGYVALAVHEGRLGGLTGWVALYSSDAFLALFVALVFGLLLFPDGHLLSRRWRVVAWMGVAGLCLFLPSVVLRVGKLDGYPRIESPAGVDSPILSWIAAPGYFLFSLAAVAAAVSVVLRFRRSRGVERQQLTLLVAAGAVAVTTFVVGGPVGAIAGSEDLGITIMLGGILSIPAAMGMAMLRYRLYEIDRVISRTIVYGALTVILGAAYAGLVLAGQEAFSRFAGGSDLAIAVSTLVVAALFLPARSRVQRLVDRRFYRRRYDAQRTLDSFGARLRDQVELDRLRADLQDVVRDTMQPVHVSLWLKKGTR